MPSVTKKQAENEEIKASITKTGTANTESAAYQKILESYMGGIYQPTAENIASNAVQTDFNKSVNDYYIEEIRAREEEARRKAEEEAKKAQEAAKKAASYSAPSTAKAAYSAPSTAKTVSTVSTAATGKKVKPNLPGLPATNETAKNAVMVAYGETEAQQEAAAKKAQEAAAKQNAIKTASASSEVTDLARQRSELQTAAAQGNKQAAQQIQNITKQIQNTISTAAQQGEYIAPEETPAQIIAPATSTQQARTEYYTSVNHSNVLAAEMREKQANIDRIASAAASGNQDAILQQNILAYEYNRAANEKALADNTAYIRKIEADAFHTEMQRAAKYSDAAAEQYINDIAAAYDEYMSLYSSGAANSAIEDASAGRMDSDSIKAFKDAENRYKQLTQEFETWKLERYAYDAQTALNRIDSADREGFLKLAEVRGVNSVTAAANGDFTAQNVKELSTLSNTERTLKSKYGEDYALLMEYAEFEYNLGARQRQQENIKELISGNSKAQNFANAVFLSGASVISNVLAAPSAVYEIVSQPFTKASKYTPYDINAGGFRAQNLTSDIRGAITEDMGKVGSLVYSTVMSGLDSAAAMMIAGSSGGALLGATAATNAMSEITERGGSMEQAITGGIAAGVFEGLFESVSIGNFEALKEKGIVNTVKDYLKNVGKSTIVNFSEEAATETANILYDMLVMGDVSNYQTEIRRLMNEDGLSESQAKKALAAALAVQIAEAGISGALMGAAFGAIGGGVRYSQRGITIQAEDSTAFVKFADYYNTAKRVLPWEYQPEARFTAGKTTDAEVENYGRAVMKSATDYLNDIREGKVTVSNDVKSKLLELSLYSAYTKASVSEVTDAYTRGADTANAEAANAAATVGEDASKTSAEGIYTAEKNSTLNRGTEELNTVGRVDNTVDNQVDTVDNALNRVDNNVNLVDNNVNRNVNLVDNNVNGGITNEEAQQIKAETYTAAEAQSDTQSERGISLSDGQGRIYNASAEVETGSMAEGAGNGTYAGAGSTGEKVSRGNIQKILREEVERVTSYGLGLDEGNFNNTETYEIPEKYYADLSLDGIAEDLRRAGASSVTFISGTMSVTGANGASYSVAAATTPDGGVIISADNSISPEKLAKHEMFHLRFNGQESAISNMVEKISAKYPKERINSILNEYFVKYFSVYGMDENRIFAEFLADAFAGINRFSEAVTGADIETDVQSMANGEEIQAAEDEVSEVTESTAAETEEAAEPPPNEEAEAEEESEGVKSFTADLNASIKRLTDKYSIANGERANIRGAIENAALEAYADGEVNITTAEELADAIINNSAEDNTLTDFANLRAELKGARIYVDDKTKAEFGDDWQNFRSVLMGFGIYTTNNPSDVSIDRFYHSMYGQYMTADGTGQAGFNYDAEETDARTMLEDIVSTLDTTRASTISLEESAANEGMSRDALFAEVFEDVYRELARFAEADVAEESYSLSEDEESSSKDNYVESDEEKEYREKINDYVNKHRIGTEAAEEARKVANGEKRFSETESDISGEEVFRRLVSMFMDAKSRGFDKIMSDYGIVIDNDANDKEPEVKISKTYTTLKTIFGDYADKVVNPENFKYNVKHHAKAIERAKDMLSSRTLGDIAAELMPADRAWTAEDVVAAWALYDVAMHEAANTGDYSGAADWSVVIAEHQQTAGQAIEIQKLVKQDPKQLCIQVAKILRAQEGKAVLNMRNAKTVLDELNREYDKVKDKDGDIEKQRTNIDDLNDEVSRLKKENADGKKKLNDARKLKEKVDNLNEEISKKRKAYDKAKAEYDRLNDEFKKAKADNSRLNSNIEAMKNRIADKLKALEDARNEWKTANDKLNILREENKTLYREIYGTVARTETANKRIDELENRRLPELVQRLARAEQELRKANEKLDILRGERNRLNDAIRSAKGKLNTELKKTKLTKEQINSSLEELGKIINDYLNGKTQYQNEVMKNVVDLTDALSKIENGDRDGLIDVISRATQARRLAGEKGLSRRTINNLRTERRAGVSNDELRAMAEGQIISIAKDYDKVGFGRKISTFQAISHLLNFPTTNRNNTSNLTGDVFFSANTNLAALLDRLLSLRHEENRVVPFDRSWFSKEKRLGAIQGLRRGIIEAKYDIYVNENESGKYDTAKRRTWNMQTSDAAGMYMSEKEKIMGYALNATDEFLKGSVYNEAMRGYKNMIESGALTQEEAEELAHHEALVRSYQDDNVISRTLTDVKKALNNLGIERNGYSFGFGDFFQKYTQVPGALMMRSIEYSPLGLVKAIYEFAQIKNATDTGEAKLARYKAMQSLASFMTGTSLIFVSSVLSSHGIIYREEDEEDKDKRALLRKAGATGTQLNVSALWRFIVGKDTARQDGDISIGVGFLEPLNFWLNMGYEYNKTKEFKGWERVGETAKGIITAYYKAISELSMMQTIHDIEEAIKYTDNDEDVWENALFTFIVSNISGFIPSYIRQFAKATDKYQRDMYSENGRFSELYAKFANSIPILRETLPAKLDNYGEPIEYENALLNALNSAFLPGGVYIYESGDIYDELYRLDEATGGEYSLYQTRYAPYSISFKLDEHEYGALTEEEKALYTQNANGTYKADLTAEERQTYQKTRGATTSLMLVELMASDIYKDATEYERAYMVANINKIANDMAMHELYENRGYSYKATTYDKYYDEIAAGVPSAIALDMQYRKSELKQFEAEKGVTNSANRKAIEHIAGIEGLDNSAYSQLIHDYVSDSRSTQFDKYAEMGLTVKDYAEDYMKYTDINAMDLGATDKAAELEAYVDGKEGYTDLQKGDIKYMFREWSNIPAVPQTYRDLYAKTGDAELALDISKTISTAPRDIDPETGEKKALTESQKMQAIIGRGDDAGTTVKAMSALSTDGSKTQKILTRADISDESKVGIVENVSKLPSDASTKAKQAAAAAACKTADEQISAFTAYESEDSKLNKQYRLEIAKEYKVDIARLTKFLAEDVQKYGDVKNGELSAVDSKDEIIRAIDAEFSDYNGAQKAIVASFIKSNFCISTTKNAPTSGYPEGWDTGVAQRLYDAYLRGNEEYRAQK